MLKSHYLLALLPAVLLFSGCSGDKPAEDGKRMAQMRDIGVAYHEFLAHRELEILKLGVEAKQQELDREAKLAADARKKLDEELRERRAQEDRIREENRRALAAVDDDAARAALKKKQQLEQEQRDKEAREREDRFNQLLDDSQKKLEQAKKDKEAARTKGQMLATAPAPMQASDLIPYIKNEDAKALLTSGDIVFLWGVTVQEMARTPAKSEGTILAYEKDAPTKGGLALFGDGVVKNLSAEEFNKTPKAKQ
jgi:hypothetical protein